MYWCSVGRYIERDRCCSCSVVVVVVVTGGVNEVASLVQDQETRNVFIFLFFLMST